MSTAPPTAPAPPPRGKPKRGTVIGGRKSAYKGRPPDPSLSAKKAKVGRPTKFSPELATKLLEYLRIPTPLVHAAGAVGVTVRTLENWRDRGAADEAAGKPTEFAKFFRDLMLAHHGGIADLNKDAIAWIREQKSWQGARNFLSVFAPLEYGSARGRGGDDGEPPPPAVVAIGPGAPPAPKIFLPAEVEDLVLEDEEESTLPASVEAPSGSG